MRVRRWLVGAGVANVSVVDPLRELAEEGKLHASADIRGRVIEVRVTRIASGLARGPWIWGLLLQLRAARPVGERCHMRWSTGCSKRCLPPRSAICGLQDAMGEWVGNVAAWVERFASDLAGSMAQMLGSNARIEVDEDLGFRLPLAVAPDGEHGVYAYLKGADFVKDSRGARRYRLWGEAEPGWPARRDCGARSRAMPRAGRTTCGIALQLQPVRMARQRAAVQVGEWIWPTSREDG